MNGTAADRPRLDRRSPNYTALDVHFPPFRTNVSESFVYCKDGAPGPRHGKTEEPEVGIEPTAWRLQGACSGRLSYSGSRAEVTRRSGGGLRRRAEVAVVGGALREVDARACA